LEFNVLLDKEHHYRLCGNGDLATLINAADGTSAGQCEYGPFGEVIRANGPMAKTNPFRFSTKYQDDETDLLYFGYRYYNANTGRWLSRDPLEEQGFRTLRRGRSRVASQIPAMRREDGNPYVLLRKNPLNDIDLLGLCDPPCKCGEDVTPWVFHFRKGSVLSIVLIRS
jgi:RHS repeat-associated protein